MMPMSTLSKPKKPARKDWHKSDVKAALEKAGKTLRQLSKEHEMSPSYFKEALHRPVPRAQAVIADVLGLSPWEIWPSRYDEHGQPKRGLYTAILQRDAHPARSVRPNPARANVRKVVGV